MFSKAYRMNECNNIFCAYIIQGERELELFRLCLILKEKVNW